MQRLTKKKDACSSSVHDKTIASMWKSIKSPDPWNQQGLFFSVNPRNGCDAVNIWDTQSQFTDKSIVNSFSSSFCCSNWTSASHPHHIYICWTSTVLFNAFMVPHTLYSNSQTNEWLLQCKPLQLEVCCPGTLWHKLPALQSLDYPVYLLSHSHPCISCLNSLSCCHAICYFVNMLFWM